MNDQGHHTPAAGVAPWRRYGLRVLFTLGVIWALLLGFSQHLFEWMTDVPYETLWGWLTLALVATVGCGVTCGSYVVWRRFLRIPPAIGAAAVAGRLLVAALVVAVAVGAVFATVEYLILRQTGDPRNPQYGLSVFFAAMWYPAVLTPALAVVAAWLTFRRRDRAPGR